MPHRSFAYVMPDKSYHVRLRVRPVMMYVPHVQQVLCWSSNFISRISQFRTLYRLGLSAHLSYNMILECRTLCHLFVLMNSRHYGETHLTALGLPPNGRA